jgi:hypothetical protein
MSYGRFREQPEKINPWVYILRALVMVAILPLLMFGVWHFFVPFTNTTLYLMRIGAIGIAATYGIVVLFALLCWALIELPNQLLSKIQGKQMTSITLSPGGDII